MGWTKQQIIEQAFAELGLAARVFDLEDEELEDALRRLDTMMGTWEARGIRLGYPVPSSPDDSDLDDDSNLPAGAVETVYLNLAVRIAPGYGKAVRIESRMAASDGYDALERVAAMPRQQQLRSIPAGAGNRWCRPFTPVPDDSPLQVDEAGNLDLQE
jgi:hypothetical protein